MRFRCLSRRSFSSTYQKGLLIAKLTCNWRLRQEIMTIQVVLRSRFLDHRISGKSEINITVRKRLRHSGLDESICSKD